MRTDTGLTARQKAAVIVRVLLSDGGEVSLERLPPTTQAALAHEMALMGIVDRATRDAVVQEFCDSLEEIGVTFPGDLGSTLDFLETTLSTDTTDRLRRLAAISGAADPWDRIAALPPECLAELALAEATEIAAVMFSRLPVPKAAQCFALMPADRARRVAYAMSMTSAIEQPALRRVGLALLQAAEALSRPALEGGAVEKVGAILNYTTSGTRDEVLDGLEHDDAAFAAEVRKAIFTWTNIPRRIDPRDVPRIIREVEPATLARAMAGSTGRDSATAAFVLSSLPTRMGDALREQIEELGRVPEKDAERAMTDIVAAIRRMEEAGDLFLIASEAGDEPGEELPGVLTAGATGPDPGPA